MERPDWNNYFLSIAFIVSARSRDQETKHGTVIVDKNNLKGTLIMDYVSNMISLDPDNLFKKKGNIKFEKKDDIISGYADSNNFNL